MIKKIVALTITALVLAVCFLSCNSDDASDSVEIDSVEITTSMQAINVVKNYMAGTFLSTDQRIAGKLGFNNFYSPDYGTSTAEQDEYGNWDVEIKGSMSGYVDEYHQDFETKKFSIRATVSQDGNVSMHISRVY